MTHRFTAKLEIIGINPFVFVPPAILKKIFDIAGKEKGAIPVLGTVNRKPYRQTLVKYRGHWRLYVNTTMLKDSPKRMGEELELTLAHDPEDRTVPLHDSLRKALKKNKKARLEYKQLTPSRKKEINRYLHSLKAETSVASNVARVIRFLSGADRFVGRDKPGK